MTIEKKDGIIGNCNELTRDSILE